MINHIDAFNIIFGPHGGRLDLDAQPNVLEYQVLRERLQSAPLLVAALRQRPEWSKVPDIYIDIVNNKMINAGARFDPQTGCAYIGIWSGAILCIEDLFSRICSRPDFATEIGDCRAEAIQSFHANGIIREYEVSERLRARADLATTSPKDPLRRLMARALSQLAFDYLIRHEIAHIAWGHSGFLRDHGADGCIEFDYCQAA